MLERFARLFELQAAHISARHGAFDGKGKQKICISNIKGSRFYSLLKMRKDEHKRSRRHSYHDIESLKLSPGSFELAANRTDKTLVYFGKRLSNFGSFFSLRRPCQKTSRSVAYVILRISCKSESQNSSESQNYSANRKRPPVFMMRCMRIQWSRFIGIHWTRAAA